MSGSRFAIVLLLFTLFTAWGATSAGAVDPVFANVRAQSLAVPLSVPQMGVATFRPVAMKGSAFSLAEPKAAAFVEAETQAAASSVQAWTQTFAAMAFLPHPPQAVRDFAGR